MFQRVDALLVYCARAAVSALKIPISSDRHFAWCVTGLAAAATLIVLLA